MKKLLIAAVVLVLAAGITVGVLAGTGVIYVAKAGEVDRRQAQEIALTDAAADTAGVTDLDVDRERRNGEIFYEVEFKLNGVEHKYLLDVNGNILSHYTDTDDDDPGHGSGTGGNATGGSSGQSYIGATAARDAALATLGLTTADVRASVELDDYRGSRAYEVDFTYGYYEYEIYVDPFTGEILRSNAPAAEYISVQAALDAALADAALKGSPWDIEIELEGANYKVEFEYSGYEYEYLIDAATGAVVYSHSERD